MRDFEVIERTIIKADPDWHVAYYLHEEDGSNEQLLTMPIIAWEVKYVRLSNVIPGKNPKYYYDCQPLTPEGEPDGTWCLLSPNEHYIFQEDTVIYSEKDALEHFHSMRSVERLFEKEKE